MRSSCLFAMLAALTACGTPALDPDLPVEARHTPIFGGSAPNAPEHAAVVGLHQRSGGSVAVSPFCSGTLIAADVVLTAAHCLDTARGGKRTFQTMSANAVAIYVGDHAASDPAPQVIAVTENLIHPSYDRLRNRDDIALMRLAAPAAGVSPVPALPASLGLGDADIGAALNFAGFGLDEHGTSGVKLQADVPLGGFGCTVAGCPDPGVAATMISYAQPEAGPCSGDSGGPAFISRGGSPYVAGITSYGDSFCTIYGVSTRTDAFEAFIDDFLTPPPPPSCEADGVCDPSCPEGADPDCAGPPPPDGCGDGTCDVGESCDGREGTISCPDDCAGRTGGKPSRRYCYANGACEGPGCP